MPDYKTSHTFSIPIPFTTAENSSFTLSICVSVLELFSDFLLGTFPWEYNNKTKGTSWKWYVNSWPRKSFRFKERDLD